MRWFTNILFAFMQLELCCHDDSVLRQTLVQRNVFEGAELRVEVEHPPVARPQLTENSSGA